MNCCLRCEGQELELNKPNNKLHVGHEGGIKFAALDSSFWKIYEKKSNVDENVYNFHLGCWIFAHKYNPETLKNCAHEKRVNNKPMLLHSLNNMPYYLTNMEAERLFYATI